MSMRIATFFESLARTLAVALVLALLATVGLWYTLQRGTQRTITAYFPTTIGLYEQNTVNVQGIPVGTVEEIAPQGDVVRVVMKVDNEVPVAADARAVILSPTLVSDRYVQLGPPYSGGPMMPDGAVIPRERTAVPVEVDQVYRSLDMLATALGPNGANRTGALSELLRSSANFLGGNGAALKNTITEFSGAIGTLSDNRANLFATMRNLGQFTDTLARSDGQVRALNLQLQDISRFLASERGDLSRVLATLPPALEDVARFVRDNRDILRADVEQLANITDILVRQRRALTELSDIGPLGLGNLANVYNASSGTLDVRNIIAPELLNSLDPRSLLCGLLNQPGVPEQAGALSDPMDFTRAQVVCGALLDPQSLAQALEPFRTLLAAIGAQPTADALLNAVPGSPVPNGPDTGVAPSTVPGLLPGATAPGAVPPPPGAPAPGARVRPPGSGMLGLGDVIGGPR